MRNGRLLRVLFMRMDAAGVTDFGRRKCLPYNNLSVQAGLAPACRQRDEL